MVISGEISSLVVSGSFSFSGKVCGSVSFSAVSRLGCKTSREGRLSVGSVSIVSSDRSFRFEF